MLKICLGRLLIPITLILLVLINHTCAAEVSKQQTSDIDLSDQLLTEASKLEEENSASSFWQAAKLYCKAAKLGNVEGQYRLGILYAFGKGVPESRIYATSLFSSASKQGHYQAIEMLETMPLIGEEVPPCISLDAEPEQNLAALSAKLVDRHFEEYIKKIPKQKLWMIDLVEKISKWYQVDPKLTISIIAIESNFNSAATSNARAMGLMQLIPQTADRFNVNDAFNASQNIKGGVRYLRWLIDYYAGDLDLAVAAYNAGERAVDKYRGVPPYQETKDYVRKFRLLYEPKSHSYRDVPNKSPLKN